MGSLPPTGALATSGVPLAYTIVVIERGWSWPLRSPSACLRPRSASGRCTRRARRRIKAAAPAPQAAVSYAALGDDDLHGSGLRRAAPLCLRGLDQRPRRPPRQPAGVG